MKAYFLSFVEIRFEKSLILPCMFSWSCSLFLNALLIISQTINYSVRVFASFACLSCLTIKSKIKRNLKSLGQKLHPSLLPLVSRLVTIHQNRLDCQRITTDWICFSPHSTSPQLFTFASFHSFLQYGRYLSHQTSDHLSISVGLATSFPLSNCLSQSLCISCSHHQNFIILSPFNPFVDILTSTNLGPSPAPTPLPILNHQSSTTRILSLST